MLFENTQIWKKQEQKQYFAVGKQACRSTPSFGLMCSTLGGKNYLKRKVCYKNNAVRRPRLRWYLREITSVWSIWNGWMHICGSAWGPRSGLSNCTWPAINYVLQGCEKGHNHLVRVSRRGLFLKVILHPEWFLVSNNHLTGLQSESEGSGTYKTVSLVGWNSNHLFNYLSSKQETLYVIHWTAMLML